MQWWRGSIYEMEFGEFALRHVSQQINFFTFSFVAQMHCIFSRMSRYSMSGRRVLLLPVVAWAVDFDKFLRSGRSPIAHQYQPSFLFSRDLPERDSARAPASLSGRISCRSRSKINSKILLLTGAQDLLPEQDLLLEQKLLLDQEHMLEQKLHTSHSRINVFF